MTTTMLRLALVATLGAALLACEDDPLDPSSKVDAGIDDAGLYDGGIEDSGVTGDPTAEEICADLAALRCARLFECGPDSSEASYTDEAGCRDRLGQACVARATAEGASIDPSKVEACQARLESDSCTIVWDYELGACPITVGSLVAGSACYFDEQCKGLCHRDHHSQACGVCTDERGEGEACSPDPDDGAVCAAGLTCREDVCRAERTVAIEGENCDNWTRCASSLFCDDGACVAQSPAESACSEPSECSTRGRLFCDEGACAPIPTAAVGEACPPLGTEGGAMCSGGAVCVGFVCVTPPAAGAPCGAGGDATLCAADARCIEGVCRAALELSCAGGPVVVDPNPPASTFVFDIPAIEVPVVACDRLELTMGFVARYSNSATTAVDATITRATLQDAADAVDVALDVVPAQVLGIVGTATAASHAATARVDASVCAHCDEAVSLHVTVDLDDGRTFEASAPMVLTCTGR